MMTGWSFSKGFLAIKFGIVAAAAIVFHIVAFGDLAYQRDNLAQGGFDSGRLEALSRMEKEFHQVFDLSRQYVQGTVSKDDLNLAFDVLWSRVGAGADERRSQMYAERKIDIQFLNSLKDTLPQIESSIINLKVGDYASLEPMQLLHDKFAAPLSDFADAGYAVRVRNIQENSSSQWELFETLKKYQVAFSVYGAVLLFVLLGELVWADRAVTRLRSSADNSKRMAETDHLTGLLNRRSLDIELTRRLAGNNPVTAIGVDLDRFSSVNGSFGHHIGDKLLVEMANRIQLAANGGLVGRIAGDEFIVLLDLPMDEAREVAARIRHAASASVDIGDRFYQPSISISIVQCLPQYSTEDIFQQLNATMIEAKSLAGGRMVEFHPDMLKSVRERAVIEADLPDAIKAGSIEIVAQPKVTIESGSPFGFEALARWNHPVLGWVSPERFCGVADSVGLSSVLGLAVADRAFQLGATLKSSGLGGRISINVSPAFGSHPAFVPDILDLLGKHGLQPSDVGLEVTEEAMLSNIGSVRANMAEMRRLGATIAIDDFGKGYSNISRLTKLDVSVIKVDKSVTDGALGDRSARAIIKSLVQLAKDLQMELIVEGVETKEQAHLLEQLGVVRAQGYLFGRPMSALQYLAWTEEKLRPSKNVVRLQPAVNT